MVREVWIAKPGKASKMAKQFKEWGMGDKVFTDMTGVFNKVVIETEYEDLAAYEKKMAEYMTDKGSIKDSKSDKEPKWDMGEYHEMFTQGKREIYRIW